MQMMTISSMHQEPNPEPPWEAPSPEAGYSGWTQLYTDPQPSNQQYEAAKQWSKLSKIMTH